MPIQTPQLPKGANTVSPDNASPLSPYIPFFVTDVVYQTIVQPEQVFTLSHYFLDAWLPCLNPAHAWLIIALRQRCFLNQNRPWCEVSYQQLAADTGLHPATVKNFFQAPYTTWFVPRTQSQYRFHPSLEQTVRAPSRYWLSPTEPAAPSHLAGLLSFFQQAGLAHLDGVLRSLTKRPTAELRQHLTEIGTGIELPVLAEGTVPALVEYLHGSPLKEPARRYSQALHRRLVAGRRLLGTQYFRLQWVPLLGPALAWLVVLLRSRCYHNPKTGQARHTYTWNKQELARALGQTPRHVFGRLLEHPFAPAFFEILDSNATEATFRVRMWQEQEPLTPADLQRLGPEGVQLPLWSDFFDSTPPNFLTVGLAEADFFDSHAQASTGQISPTFKHSLSTINHLKAPGSYFLNQTSKDSRSDESGLSLSKSGNMVPEKNSPVVGLEDKEEVRTSHLSTSFNEVNVSATDEERWRQTLDHLRLRMPRATFEKWLRSSRLVSRRDEILVIEVTSEYARDWLQHRLLTVIREAVQFVWRQPFDIEFQVSQPG